MTEVGNFVGKRHWGRLLLSKAESAWGLFFRLFPVLLLLGFISYSRRLWTPFLYDEYEAILNNRFVVTAYLPWTDVLELDFWGRRAAETIGSYRPLPLLIWKILWRLSYAVQEGLGLKSYPAAFVFQLFNICFHALNASLLGVLIWKISGRLSDAWFSALFFGCSALLVEAVAGIVGLGDILAALFFLISLHVLLCRTPLRYPLLGLLCFLGMMAKESYLVVIPVIPVADIIVRECLPSQGEFQRLSTAQQFFRLLKMLPRFAWVSAMVLGGFIAQISVRKAHFHVLQPLHLRAPILDDISTLVRLKRAFLIWYESIAIPSDPIGNVLIKYGEKERLWCGLEIYAKSLFQALFPWQLSPDYSYPQEIPPESPGLLVIIGALLMFVLPLLALLVFFGRLLRDKLKPRDALFLWAMIFIAWSFFPQSNIPLVIPAIRADRFWYFPMIGVAIVMGLALSSALRRRSLWLLPLLALLLFQIPRARIHADAWSYDLSLWKAAVENSPRSAKAHLNYGAILGNRGRLDERVVHSKEALRLAPRWVLARYYLPDSLCRAGKFEEAFPLYQSALNAAPQDKNLVVMALQCLWDSGMTKRYKKELEEIAEENANTWAGKITKQVLETGKEFNGVHPEFRPPAFSQLAPP